MYNFCTYFDKNFLFRGLALYYSLIEQKIPFKLHILGLDKTTMNLLFQLKLKNIYLIDLSTLEKVFPELLKAKENRSKVEYYWTLTPYLTLYLLQISKKIDIITYLDADLVFFNSPQALYEEMKYSSVFIIPHRLKKRDAIHEKNWGKYNVGYMMFRNDDDGKNVLEWWSKKCLEWCYYKIEENRAGDQKYLDYFFKIYPDIIESKNHGAGIGNWNIHYYNYKLKHNTIFVLPQNVPFIVCHFNKVFILNKKGWILNIGKGYFKYKVILKPYSNYLLQAITAIENIQKDFSFGFDKVNLRLLFKSFINGQIVKGKLK